MRSTSHPCHHPVACSFTATREPTMIAVQPADCPSDSTRSLYACSCMHIRVRIFTRARTHTHEQGTKGSIGRGACSRYARCPKTWR